MYFQPYCILHYACILHFSDEENTIINIIYTENTVTENQNRISTDIDSNHSLQNSISREVKEEALLRKQFEKFRKTSRQHPNFILNENLGKSSKHLLTTRRRSFHRYDQPTNQLIDHPIHTIPCLLHHHHPERHQYNDHHQTYANYNFSDACRLKSNSMPRSFVERKQRKKRPKIGIKLDSQLPKASCKHRKPCDVTEEALFLPPMGKKLKSEPVTTISEVSNSFVPKCNNNQLVYLQGRFNLVNVR